MLHAYCPHSREGSARSPHMSTRDAASNLPGPSAATSAPPAPAPRDGAPARGVAAPRPPADPRRTHFPPAAGRRPVAPVPGEGARPATRCGVHHLSHTHVARLRTRAPLRSNTPRCADTACHHPTPRNTERGARGPAGRRSPGSRRPPPSERGDARPGRLCVGRTKARHSAFPATPAPPLRAALPAHHPTYPGRWSSVEWGCHSAASGAACCSAPHSKNGGGGRVGWPGPPQSCAGVVPMWPQHAAAPLCAAQSPTLFARATTRSWGGRCSAVRRDRRRKTRDAAWDEASLTQNRAVYF